MTSLQTTDIQLHQTLHGYNRGHRLLASSCKLSADSERRMRLKSDFTGSSQRSGFDTYLTAYPLESEPFVAFARTWYANEMRRPGCVWTHTILLPHSYLATIANLGQLLPCFRRPSTNDLADYEQPLSFAPQRNSQHLEFTHAQIAALLKALYGHPDEAVFLASETSESVEDLVLSVWSQQWPSLRRNFSFCTGVLELRGPEHVADLQVVPRNDSRILRGVGNVGLLVDFKTDTITNVSEPLCLASHDIAEPTTKFRRFLHSFGSPRHDRRRYFEKYASIFSVLDANASDAEAAATSIAMIFPEPDDAVDLKRGVMGPPKAREYFTDTEDCSLLRAMVEADPRAFSSDEIAFVERFSNAWIVTRKEAMTLFQRARTSADRPLYQSLVDVVAEEITGKELGEVARWNCDAALDVVSSNIQLMANDTAWLCLNCSGDHLPEAFRDTLRCDSRFASSVIRAQTASDRSDQIEFMDDVLGEELVSALFNSGPDIARRVDTQHLAHWMPFLRKYQDAALRWLQNRNGDTDDCDVFAGRGLLVGKHDASKSVLRVWSRLCAEVVALTSSASIHAAMVVLAAAFDEGGPDGEEACRVAFPMVYNAAIANGLTDEDWSSLRSRLPRFGPKWDRCRKLRAGLIVQCVRHMWSEETIVQCTRRDDILDEILSSWGWDRKEKQLLKAVASEIDTGHSDATVRQKSAAARYLSSFWV